MSVYNSSYLNLFLTRRQVGARRKPGIPMEASPGILEWAGQPAKVKELVYDDLQYEEEEDFGFDLLRDSFVYNYIPTIYI